MLKKIILTLLALLTIITELPADGIIGRLEDIRRSLNEVESRLENLENHLLEPDQRFVPTEDAAATADEECEPDGRLAVLEVFALATAAASCVIFLLIVVLDAPKRKRRKTLRDTKERE